MSKSKTVVLRNDDVRKDSGPRPTAFYAECAGEQVPLCSQTSRALSRRLVIILIFCQSGPSAWKNGGHCLIAVFAFCCCCFFFLLRPRVANRKKQTVATAATAISHGQLDNGDDVLCPWPMVLSGSCRTAGTDRGPLNGHPR